MTKTEEKAEIKRQIGVIIPALVAAGALPKHFKLGNPVFRGGQFHCKIGDNDFVIWFSCYNAHANVWRITVQDHDNSPYDHELTYHASEVNEDMGEQLYHLLLGKTNKQMHVWNLFAVDTSYPKYAWTTEATVAYAGLTPTQKRYA